MDENQTFDQDRILKINIEEEMKSSYIDYSMSELNARALPDVRDAFKPLQNGRDSSIERELRDQVG